MPIVIGAIELNFKLGWSSNNWLTFHSFLNNNNNKEIIPHGETNHPIWIENFPLFEETLDETTGKLIVSSVHHPFTAPLNDEFDLKMLNDCLVKDNVSFNHLKPIRGNHFDLVFNGIELGGGSIRIHNYSLQKQIFEKILKIPSNECEEKFGHLLSALSYGAPPHAGFI